jgi:hypothetical protein
VVFDEKVSRTLQAHQITARAPLPKARRRIYYASHCTKRDICLSVQKKKGVCSPLCEASQFPLATTDVNLVNLFLAEKRCFITQQGA